MRDLLEDGVVTLGLGGAEQWATLNAFGKAPAPAMRLTTFCSAACTVALMGTYCSVPPAARISLAAAGVWCSTLT